MKIRKHLTEGLTIEDFELIVLALDGVQKMHEDRVKEEMILGHEAIIRRFTGYLNRADRMREYCDMMIRKIRGEKFEEHKKSKRWWRGVLGNSRNQN